MNDATGETVPVDSFINPSSICPPHRSDWLHYEAIFQEYEHGVRSSLLPLSVCANLWIYQPFPDVVSTSGAHLITQPNTPPTSRPPLDAHDLTARLYIVQDWEVIRQNKYGAEIADEFRIRHTPIEARERYEEARRKAQEEWENYVPSDTEDEEQDEKRPPARPESRIQHAPSTQEKEGAAGENPSRLQRPGWPGPGSKLDSVIHVQQSAQAVPAATITKVDRLSPPARPKKRKALVIKDKENEAAASSHRTKRKRSLPRWAGRQWASDPN